MVLQLPFLKQNITKTYTEHIKHKLNQSNIKTLVGHCDVQRIILIVSAINTESRKRINDGISFYDVMKIKRIATYKMGAP